MWRIMLAWSQFDIPDETLRAFGNIVLGVVLIAMLLGFLGIVLVVRLIKQRMRERKKLQTRKQ